MYSANYHKIWCKDGTLDYHQNLKISSMTKVHYIEFRLGLRLQLRLGGLIILRIEGCVLLSVYLTVMICQYRQPWWRYALY